MKSRQSQEKLLLAEPNAIDKILADELNSLSFDDREALSEEMHGVRSLAPEESPEMIRNALSDLRKEIDDRLGSELSLLPPSTSLEKVWNNNINDNKTSRSSKSSGNNTVNRREYLSGILHASMASSSSSSSSSSSEEDDITYPLAVPSNASAHLSPPITTSDPSVGFETCMNGNNNNTDPSRYAYVLSDGFRIKFLRAELFDVKKAAGRYLKCVDFLVDYFGLVALERPLYLKDFDKEDMKLLKEGRCQLMPSRDRFGRRIICFLGAFGKGYTHRNRFKVCMYNVFQAASDDETTQRNGLVALYDCMDNSGVHIMRMAVHQKECQKFFEAVPVRYSAFHCFLPDALDIIRGPVMNMVGKRTRLITRIHTVSSVMETFYKLRCFGIPTEDFPVTSSGSIKTKKLFKWIKFRIAMEEAFERGENLSSSHQRLQNLLSSRDTSPNKYTRSNNGPSPSPAPFLGIECPQLDSVIFRNGGSAWEHPGNIKFRAILTRMEPNRELQKTMAEKNAFLDEIISELVSAGLTFVAYDDDRDWYVELRDYGMLRKKVFQALRDQSARRKRLDTGGRGGKARRKPRGETSERRPPVFATHQTNESSTSIFMELDHVKRRKTGDDWST